MNSLIRDVLFPSAAAIGLLGAALFENATAADAVAAGPTVTAPVSAAPSKEASRPATGDEGERSASVVERRCDRTGRIGKFRITRCD